MTAEQGKPSSVQQEARLTQIGTASRPHQFQSHGIRKPAQNPFCPAGTHRAPDTVREGWACPPNKGNTLRIVRGAPAPSPSTHGIQRVDRTAVLMHQIQDGHMGRVMNRWPRTAQQAGKRPFQTSVRFRPFGRRKRRCSRRIATSSVVASWPPELAGRTAGSGKPNALAGSANWPLGPGLTLEPLRFPFASGPSIPPQPLGSPSSCPVHELRGSHPQRFHEGRSL